MLKVFGADVVVSKDFDNEDPVWVSENGKVVSFHFGEQKYDTRAKDNKRWINMTAKASGDLVDRIKNMKLKVGSTLIISGDLDIEKGEGAKGKWTEVIVWLTDIKYQYTGSGKSENSEEQAKGKTQSGKKSSSKSDEAEYESYDDDGDDPF